MHISLRPRLSLLGLLTVTAALGAQPPSPWTVLQVPGGVAPANIRQIGKVITYVDQNQVHAYSAFTHRFVAVPTSGSPVVRVANDLALVQDGLQWHAFAAYTGQWSSVTLSSVATVLNPTTQQNDSIWLIQDGNDLWAFTAFRGSWIRLTVPPSALVQTERHVAIVVDGTTLHGLSALHGTWVTTTAAAQPLLFRARGTAALAATSTTAYGFSALSNAWTTAPTPGPNAQIVAHDDVQVLSDQGNYLGFSGLRGTFASAALGNVSTQLGETVCYATDGGSGHFVYSAVTGTWTTLPTTTGSVTTHVESNSVLVAASDRVHAFSAMTGTVATALVSPSLVQVARSIAALTDTNGGIKFFSAILGAWIDAPAGSASAEVSDVAGFVRTATGVSAFSSRTGRFTPLAVGPAATTTIAPGNAVQAVVEPSTFHVFDPRRERWLSAPLQSTPTIGTHRTTLMVLDGNRAWGYGSFSARLTPIDLPTFGSIVRPNSESGSIDVGSAIFAHSSS
ncbi:MAG TPA: hypothetical protein VK081_04160, partial [Planctomycetota bacterium]|nr:hypothetical protein [Planctomycetota bacterium]